MDHGSARRILWGALATALLVLGAGALGAATLLDERWLWRLATVCMGLARQGLGGLWGIWARHPVSTTVLGFLAGSLAWATGRRVMEVVATRRLAKDLAPYVPGTWADLDAVLAGVDLPQGCKVALARGMGSPAFTVGMWRPWICLSPNLLRGLSRQELRATVLHEEAHVERRDPLRLFCVRLACDFLWFLPASRWVGRLFQEVAERAADDRAVALSARPLDLASAIVKSAQMIGRRGLPAPALTATAAVEARVEHLLDRRMRRSVVRVPGVRMVSSAAVFALVVGSALTPVAYEVPRFLPVARGDNGSYAGLWCHLPGNS